MSSSAELAALGGHSQAHHDAIFWIAAAFFAVVVVTLVMLFRRSQRKVEMEEIDELLRREEVL